MIFDNDFHLKMRSLNDLVDPMKKFRASLGIESINSGFLQSIREMDNAIRPFKNSAIWDLIQNQKHLSGIDKFSSLYKSGVIDLIEMQKPYQLNLITVAFDKNRQLADVISNGLSNSFLVDNSWNNTAKSLMSSISAGQELFNSVFKVYSSTMLNHEKHINLFEAVNSKFQMQVAGLTLKGYAGFDEFRSDMYAIPKAGILLDYIFEEVQDIESNGISEYGLAIYRIADSIEELLQLVIDRITLNPDQQKALMTGLLALKHYLFVYFLPVASLAYGYHLSQQTSKEISDLKNDIEENHQEVLDSHTDIKASSQSILENQGKIMNGLEQLNLNDQDLQEQLTEEMDEIKEHQNEIDVKIDSIVNSLSKDND